MPGKFETQSGCWLLWTERMDNWRDGAKLTQKAFTKVEKQFPDLKKLQLMYQRLTIDMRDISFCRKYR
ncbi:MAG: hypothetical protein PHE86_04860 [Candidatus Marinimicrobia bacterium]|nr:hypothetical protein [Candidatus Neomarinimicrobiota bacterium]